MSSFSTEPVTTYQNDFWNCGSVSLPFNNKNSLSHTIKDNIFLSPVRVKNLSKLLGRTDLEGQISQIELTSNFLDEQIEKAERERQKNESMYRKLGMIIGLGIVIILIWN